MLLFQHKIIHGQQSIVSQDRLFIFKKLYLQDTLEIPKYASVWTMLHHYIKAD